MKVTRACTGARGPPKALARRARLRDPRPARQRRDGSRLPRARQESRRARSRSKTVRHENPRAILRFKQEFRSLLEVVHINLVRLYELIFDGRGWYIVMELVDGADFLRYVRDDPGTAGDDWRRTGLTTTEADVGQAVARACSPTRSVPDQAPTPLSSAGRRRLRDALLQLAQGIAALHDAGKLHRDIKPSNVLVTPGGRVVLLDFGLATELGRQGLTLTLRGAARWGRPRTCRRSRRRA